MTRYNRSTLSLTSTLRGRCVKPDPHHFVLGFAVLTLPNLLSPITTETNKNCSISLKVHAIDCQDDVALPPSVP
jgi:hypothetical protein